MLKLFQVFSVLMYFNVFPVISVLSGGHGLLPGRCFAFGDGRCCFGPWAGGGVVLGSAASHASGQGVVPGLEDRHGGLPGRSVWRGAGAVDAAVGGAEEAQGRSSAVERHSAGTGAGGGGRARGNGFTELTLRGRCAQGRSLRSAGGFGSGGVLACPQRDGCGAQSSCGSPDGGQRSWDSAPAFSGPLLLCGPQPGAPLGLI